MFIYESPIVTSMTNPLTTAISDSLLQKIRDFLESESDVVSVGSDPAQPTEPNAALRLLTMLDSETSWEFAS